MFWPWQPVPSCVISYLVHSFPLSKPLMPLPWAAVTLLLFHTPLPIFLFPTWVGKMCVLVGPINLHFHGACSRSPSIPGLNPKTFICCNFLSSVLTYIDGAVLEVMIDIFQRITWTQQDLCRQITFLKNTNSGVNYVKFIFVLSACLYYLATTVLLTTAYGQIKTGTSRGEIQPADLQASVPRLWVWGRRSVLWPSSPSMRAQRGSRGLWSVTNVSIASRLSFYCGSLTFKIKSVKQTSDFLHERLRSLCASCLSFQQTNHEDRPSVYLSGNADCFSLD